MQRKELGELIFQSRKSDDNNIISFQTAENIALYSEY